MEILSETQVVIFNSKELKEVLEGTNTYTTIFLGANITLESGIVISKEKKSITLDGTYQNVTYQFTDQKSTAASSTIQASIGNESITVQNMHIMGYNYYGIIYVAEAASYKNIVLTYKNVTYVGPQMIFHPTGLSRIFDSTITIMDQYVTDNEVAECNKIELGGETKITHTSKSNSSFWFRSDAPSLTILSSSKVEFISQERELIYGTNQLQFSILQDAYFKVTTHNGLGYNTFGTGITTINENATFILQQTARNGNYATWYSYGKLSVLKNATLHILSDYPSITTNNPSLYFYSAEAGFFLNSPKEIVIYNTLASAIKVSTTIPYEFLFSRLNLFSSSISLDSSIGPNTVPTYAWYKKEDISSIVGKILTSSTSITSNNFTEKELEKLPNLSNFNLINKPIFSIGNFPVAIEKLTIDSVSIKGKTIQNASIWIHYLDISYETLADENGDFSYLPNTPFILGTFVQIEVKSPDTVIYVSKEVEVTEKEELILKTYPSVIEFTLSPFSLSPLLLPKKEEMTLEVYDSRIESSNWKLFIALASPFINENQKELIDAICILKEDGTLLPLSNEPQLFYQGKENQNGATTTLISIQKNEGIVLHLQQPIFNPSTYKATLSWSLEE